MPGQSYKEMVLGKEKEKPEFSIDNIIDTTPNSMYASFIRSKDIPDELKVVSVIESLDSLVDDPAKIFKNQYVVELSKYMKGDNETKDKIEYGVAEDYWRKRLQGDDRYKDEDIKKYAKGSVDFLRSTKNYEMFKMAIINSKIKNIKVTDIDKPILDYLSDNKVSNEYKVNFINTLLETIKKYSKQS